LKEGTTSLANEFNKKILEKGGGEARINPSELPPEAAKYYDSNFNNKPA